MINNCERYNKNLEKTIKMYDFEKLKNKSILITGVNGLIGACIVDTLIFLNNYMNYNIKIIGLVRNKSRLIDRFKSYYNLVVIEQDVINPIEYFGNIDYIIHAAGNSHPTAFSKDPIGTMLSNFIGMKNVLDLAKAKNCLKVEYISSGEIYGQATSDMLEFLESYNGIINSTNVRSCYPISKLSAETLCVSYNEQLKTNAVICRPCHCYGPTQTLDDSRVVAQFINNVLNNENIIMKSEGNQIRSYCYVIDCVMAILLILIKGGNSEAYNIANPDSVISIKEIAEYIAKIQNKKVIVQLPSENEKRSFNPVTRSVLNSDKIIGLGWKPIWDFEKGINETINIMMR